MAEDNKGFVDDQGQQVTNGQQDNFEVKAVISNTGTAPVTNDPQPEQTDDTGGFQIENSWDTQAGEEAEIEFEIETIKAEQNALKAKQELQSQQAQAINNFFGSQYISNQKANNWGWTGGALLDESTRIQYLQAGINANLYNSKELIKAGFNTELAIAKQYQELKEIQLANQYYNEAWTRALQESEATGVFISPEAQEMFDQYTLAKSILNENPDDEQAQAILDTVVQWAKNEFADDDDSLITEDLEAWSKFKADYEERNKTMQQRSLDMAEAAALREAEMQYGEDLDGDGLIGYADAFANRQTDPTTNQEYIIDDDYNKYVVEQDEDGNYFYARDEDGNRITIAHTDAEAAAIEFMDKYDTTYPIDLYVALANVGEGRVTDEGISVELDGQAYTLTEDQAETLGITIITEGNETDLPDNLNDDVDVDVDDLDKQPTNLTTEEVNKKINDVVDTLLPEAEGPDTSNARHRFILNTYYQNNIGADGDLTKLNATAQKYISGAMTPAEYYDFIAEVEGSFTDEITMSVGEPSYANYLSSIGQAYFGLDNTYPTKVGDQIKIQRGTGQSKQQTEQTNKFILIAEKVFGMVTAPEDEATVLTADNMTDSMYYALLMAWNLYNVQGITSISEIQSNEMLSWYFNDTETPTTRPSGGMVE